MAREDLQMATFGEVQALLNRTDANSSCPVPCNLCHTAQPGDACFEGVRWAMQHGIRIHPDRYPGLSEESTLEEFQSALHQVNHERCAMPCLSAGLTWRETTSMPSLGMPTVPSTETSTISEEPTMPSTETSSIPTESSDMPSSETSSMLTVSGNDTSMT